MAQSYFEQAIHKADAGVRFEEAAERNLCHVGQLGSIGQGNGFVEILFHVLHYFFYAAAGVAALYIVETAIG